MRQVLHGAAMTESWLLIGGLAIGTFTIRLAGLLLGQRLPTHGPWARGLRALPGCLIVSLVAALLLNGGLLEWVAGGLAALTAALTRSLPITMLMGIAFVAAARYWL